MATFSILFMAAGILAQVQTDFPSINFGNGQGAGPGTGNGQVAGAIPPQDGPARVPTDSGDMTKFVIVGVIILASILFVVLFVYRARFMNRNLDDVEKIAEMRDIKEKLETPTVKSPAKVKPKPTKKYDSLLETNEFELSKFGIETTIAEQSFNTLDSDPRGRGSIIYDRTISNPRDSVGLIKNVKRVTIPSFSAQSSEEESDSSTKVGISTDTGLPSALKKPLQSALKKVEVQPSADVYLDQKRYKNMETPRRPSLLGLFRRD